LDAYAENKKADPLNKAVEVAQPVSLARLRRYAERTADVSVLSVLNHDDEPLERTFDPFVPPNLTHTKITSAFFNGCALTPASWNGLLDEAVRTARRKLRSYGDLRKICHMNITEGQKTNEGYHFIPEAGVSVQGQDANDAWRCTAQIARQI